MLMKVEELNMKAKIVICVLLSFVFVGSVNAAEKIVGAFGIKLGQQFNPDNAIGMAKLTDGTPMYQFNPKKKFRLFKRYYVLITPKTHKVYGIWGISNMENLDTCKAEQKVLMAILEKKYGKAKKEGLMSALMDAKMIDQGNRYVLTKCSGIVDVTLEIRYYDMKLKNLAEKERISLEAKQVDDSAL